MGSIVLLLTLPEQSGRLRSEREPYPDDRLGIYALSWRVTGLHTQGRRIGLDPVPLSRLRFRLRWTRTRRRKGVSG